MNKCIAVGLLLLMIVHAGYAKKPIHVKIGAHIQQSQKLAGTFMQYQLVSTGIAVALGVVCTPKVLENNTLHGVTIIGVGMLGMKCMRLATDYLYTALVHARSASCLSNGVNDEQARLQSTMTLRGAANELQARYKDNFSVVKPTTKLTSLFNDEEQVAKRSRKVVKNLKYAGTYACVGIGLATLNMLYNPLGYQLTKRMLPTVGSMGARCLGPLINNVLLSSLYLLS